MIMVEQPAKQLLPTDGAECTGRRLAGLFVGGARSGWQSPVVEALVRADRVVVADVSLGDVVEVAEAEAGEVVEAFSLHTADPRLGEGVGDRRLERCLNNRGVSGSNQRIERLGELRVAVVDEVLHGQPFLSQPQRQVAGLLSDPLAGRVVGAWRDEDLAAAQVDERQAIGDALARQRPDILAEEIAGDDRVDVHLDEGSPRRGYAFGRPPIGVGQQPLIDQHTTDRTAARCQRQLPQLADDAAHAPANVLAGQAEDRLANRLCDATRPTHTSRFLTRGLLPQPPLVGLDSDDAEEIVDLMATVPTKPKQAHPILGGDDHPVARHLLAKQLDLKLEEPDLRVAPGRPRLGHEQNHHRQPVGKHQSTLRTDLRISSSGKCPTFWTTATGWSIPLIPTPPGRARPARADLALAGRFDLRLHVGGHTSLRAKTDSGPRAYFTRHPIDRSEDRSRKGRATRGK